MLFAVFIRNCFMSFECLFQVLSKEIEKIKFNYMLMLYKFFLKMFTFYWLFIVYILRTIEDKIQQFLAKIKSFHTTFCIRRIKNSIKNNLLHSLPYLLSEFYILNNFFFLISNFIFLLSIQNKFSICTRRMYRL